MLPINNDILEYLRHFIREEQMKKNNDVVQGLEKMMKDYQEEMDLFKETIRNDKDSSNFRGVLQPQEIFPLVGSLYRLPINGKTIREQVQGLKIAQENISAKRDIFVELPAKANSSKVMLQFKEVFTAQ
jgi:deoxyxylulose-5-phosphate synthase